MKTGIALRWSIASIVRRGGGKPLIPFKKYLVKMVKERDRSNAMSDGIINFLLGLCVVAIFVLLLNCLA